MRKSQTIGIKYLLRNLGTPTHILGYIYITEAVDYMVTTPNKTLFINDIYTHVAELYSTSASCVEASIRNAVKKTLKSGTPLLGQLFKNTDNVGNHLFLTTLRDVFEARYTAYIRRKKNSILVN